MVVPAIEVHNLVKSYRGVAQPAVATISFEIAAGSVFGLLGPNGAGKTTTLSMLYGVLKPDSGSINIKGWDALKNVARIKQLIGVVPQEIALYPMLTARENLSYIGRMYGLDRSTLQERMEHLLETFGLLQHADKRVETFSGGMKRRVNLMAGVLHRPEIVFLDEPTVGVDVQSRAVIIDFLKRLNEEGTTIVYTSHLMEEAQNLCKEIAIIDQGKLLLSGSPAELIAAAKCTDLESLFLQLTGRQLRD